MLSSLPSHVSRYRTLVEVTTQQQSTMGPKGMGFPTDGVDNHGWKLHITSLVMIILAGLAVVVRCISRVSLYNFGADDIVIIISLVSTLPTLPYSEFQQQ